MSGLSLSLNNALSGLNVNQQALAVLSQNIANANTAGYSKQIVNQQSVYLDGQGQGVSVQDVTRKVDQYLVSAVQRQTSDLSQSSTVSDYQDRIQILIGTPGSGTNISSYTTTFFNAVQSLTQTPDDTTLQQNVVNTANTLATGISSLSQGLYDLQLQSDQDIKTAVDNINSDLGQIQTLNGAITSANILGKSTADLQDKRDALVGDLSKYLDVKTFVRDSGAITINTSGGVTLLSESTYKLSYNPQASSLSFSNNSSLSPLLVTRIGDNGLPAGQPETLITGGTSGTVSTNINSGQLKGLLDVRDTQIPGLQKQLDNMASSLRDQMNAIHNTGSGYPPANSYTGTRLVGATDTTVWTGSARIAVVDSSGQPVPSPYGTGAPLAPLTLDLSTLNSGQGNGNPSTQTIIDEINQYYGVPQNKVQLGNLDNIQLASLSKNIPGSPPNFSFDFDLSNLSSTTSNFYVTGVSIKNDAGVSVGSVNTTVPTVALDSANTYNTTSGSSIVTIKTASTNHIIAGERIFLSTPPSDVNGINKDSLGGFFTVTNVTSTGFDIDTGQSADMNGSVGALGQTALPPYTSVASNDETRTGANGVLTANLTGATSSQYYVISANVAVDDGNGNITQSTISYRVPNQNTGILNSRYSVLSATGTDAKVLTPNTTQPTAIAMLVDSNGNELPKVNGKYAADAQGYLVIKANNTSQSIVIDSLNSAQTGSAQAPGTNRDFSYYFELNNFFQSNQPTTTGDTVARSALNLKVEQRLLDNPNTVALGSLTQSTTTPYAYERLSGDNSIITKLSALGNAAIHFDPAGGVGASSQSFAGYAGTIISTAAQTAKDATNDQTTSQTLLDGFSARSASISGVNLDTELANTVIYQNAYAASARIITVTNTLFDALLTAAGGQ